MEKNTAIHFFHVPTNYNPAHAHTHIKKVAANLFIYHWILHKYQLARHWDSGVNYGEARFYITVVKVTESTFHHTVTDGKST